MESDKITIRQFFNAWFNKDFSIISEERYEMCHAEYIDISGLYKTRAFDNYANIISLSQRVSTMSMAIQVQKELVNAFGKPYIEGFWVFEEYHYHVYWNGNAKEFLDYMTKIEKKERKFRLELETLRKLFNDEQSESVPLTQTRHQFITMINDLGKVGYKIDWDRTMVEELALMIKSNRDERH